MLSAHHTRTFAGALLLAVLAPAVRANAVESSAGGRAGSRAKLLAPFVDDQTIGVARVDVSQVAVDKWFELGQKFWFPSHPLLATQTAAQKFVDGFKQAGGRELYVVASFADLPDQPPFFLVPLQKGANEEKLKPILAAFEVQERMGDVLFAGSRKTRQRLMQAPPKSRPELQRALEAAGDGQIEFLFVPSASVRRLVEELLPTLPPSVGGGPTRSVSRGALWAAVTLDGPPDVRARLIIQGQDAAAATTLRGLWGAMLAHAGPEEAALGEAITPRLHDDRLVLQLEANGIEAIAGLVRPKARVAADFARRRQSTEHLKQIGLAMHAYADAHKHLPPAALTAADGKPLLSWRVAILPYLEQEALYKEFNLGEPWDSEHNRRLIERMPEVYRSLGAAAENRTSYVVAVGQGSVFEGTSGTAIGDITDGTSNTILAVETADEQSVIWTKPEDHAYDVNRPSAGLTSPYRDGRLILFCDGWVRFIQQALDDETLRRLLMRNDGQVVPELR